MAEVEGAASQANTFHQQRRFRYRPSALAKTWLVYLDQCIVSNMAKAKSPEWARLRDMALDAVQAGIMICPLSTSHRDECRKAIYDGPAIYELCARLSRGWRFNTYDSIRAHEVVPAFGEFATLAWRDELEHLAPRILTTTVTWNTELGQLRRDSSEIPQVEGLRQLPRAPSKDPLWYLKQESLPLAEKLCLDKLFEKQPFEYVLSLEKNYIPGLPYLLPLRMIAECERADQAKQYMMEFFCSPWYRYAPSVALETHLWAALRAQAGVWENGDFEDTRFASTLASYVDVIVVDGAMHAALTSSRILDVREWYPQLKVISAKDLDPLRDLLASISKTARVGV